MLLCAIQQALAETHYYQLCKSISVVWYQKALCTVSRVLERLERRKRKANVVENYELKGDCFPIFFTRFH